jgi:hypothetical protein
MGHINELTTILNAIFNWNKALITYFSKEPNKNSWLISLLLYDIIPF